MDKRQGSEQVKEQVRVFSAIRVLQPMIVKDERKSERLVNHSRKKSCPKKLLVFVETRQQELPSMNDEVLIRPIVHW